jgi:glucose/arabinose dehydrogenase
MTMPANSDPVDLVFYDGNQFPAEYRNDAFITLRGSFWEDSAESPRIVRVRFENGQPVEMEDFLTGLYDEEGNDLFGQVSGITVAQDGSLLVADEQNGVIYRITYGQQAQQTASRRR